MTGLLIHLQPSLLPWHRKAAITPPCHCLNCLVYALYLPQLPCICLSCKNLPQLLCIWSQLPSICLSCHLFAPAFMCLPQLSCICIGWHAFASVAMQQIVKCSDISFFNLGVNVGRKLSSLKGSLDIFRPFYELIMTERSGGSFIWVCTELD